MKNTQKHTQGPWGRNIAPAWKYPIIFAGQNTHVAKLITNELPESEQEANARLIASAPDLLEALKGLMQRAVKDAEKYAQNGNEPIWAYISDASDAIAKAEGVK